MPAIIFALISFMGWGVGDIFGTIASRKIGGYSTTFWYLILQLPLFGVFAFFFLDYLQYLTLSLLALNVFLGVIGTVGLIAFYEGVRLGNASLVGTIAAAFAAVTVILSIVFLGESITSDQAVAITIIFLGLILSSLNFKEIYSQSFKIDWSILLAVVAMFCWGIYWTFIKIPINQIGWFWPSMISLSSVILVFIFMKIRSIKLSRLNQRGVFLPLLFNAALLGIGALSFNFAIGQGLTAIVAPIAGSYPTLFVVLAFLIFKDPITRQQIAGIITTLVGIVLLSIFSV